MKRFFSIKNLCLTATIALVFAVAHIVQPTVVESFNTNETLLFIRVCALRTVIWKVRCYFIATDKIFFAVHGQLIV